LCELVGKSDDASKYLAIARDYATKWQELAKGEGRTVLAYGLANTWAMKHNLIWDRVLGLGLFPQSIGDAEIAWYLKVQKTYGLTVDNRTDTSLIDWALWSIALARNDADFQALFEPIYRYANETPSRVPLSDWYVTTDAKQKGFQARPVVGGIFIRMLAEADLWAKWARRGANVQGPWAPILIGGTTGAGVLENDYVRTEFDGRGIAVLYDKSSGQTVRFAEDGFSAGVDGDLLDSEMYTPEEESADSQRRVYRWVNGSRAVRVVYELQPDWRFVSKQINVSGEEKRASRIQRLELWRGQLDGLRMAESGRGRRRQLARFGCRE